MSKNFYLEILNRHQVPPYHTTYRDQVETLLSSCDQTFIDLGIWSEEKGRTEKFINVGSILLLCIDRLPHFHTPEN